MAIGERASRFYVALLAPAAAAGFSGMPIRERRITEKRREYQGEHTAGALVRWLNYSDDDEAKMRIRRVLSLFRELYAHFTEGEPPKKTRKSEALQAELDKKLKYYQMRPSVEFVPTFDRGVHKFAISIESIPLAGSTFDRDVKSSARKRVNFDRWVKACLTRGEVQAIQITLDLFRSRDLFKIHQCRCGKFVFQRFSHQRFCSQKCRIAAYRSSEEFRVARNAKQRELYRLHKEHNIK